MVKSQKDKNIFTQLASEFSNKSLNDFNINKILKKKSIKEEDFYNYFPNKTKSLCNFFLRDLQLKLERKVKNKINKEKSISKRVSFILKELIKLIDESEPISLYFLNYMSSKPLYLKKISFKFSNKVWRLLKDNSLDFNYYTKRIILAQILINSVLYWRGCHNIKMTETFIEKQIFFLGKFGYYKSNFKKFISRITPKDFFTKFDILH